MKTKKTVQLVKLLEKANEYLAYKGPGPNDDMRRGAASLIETALHECGAYAGFKYLDPYGAPGSNETRRFYYIHRALRANS